MEGTWGGGEGGEEVRPAMSSHTSVDAYPIHRLQLMEEGKPISPTTYTDISNVFHTSAPHLN